MSVERTKTKTGVFTKNVNGACVFTSPPSLLKSQTLFTSRDARYSDRACPSVCLFVCLSDFETC